MLYALICTDKPGHLETRMNNRPAHVEWLESLGGALKAAGPFLGPDEKPAGSLVIIEAADMAAAETLAAADPYAKAGLFAHVDIRAWKWVFKNPEG
jgi:uncharacterized protein YciI